jgi:hemerythrin-like domain-containing protein
MKTLRQKEDHHVKSPGNERREFLKKSAFLGTLAGASGLGLLTACKEEAEEEVTPSEDLMREHGLLNRILLIYDAYSQRLINNFKVSLEVLLNAALIIRNFIENYHEKLEEDFLFPRFEKANVLTDLVEVLRNQHKAGRVLTEQIIRYGKMQSLPGSEESQKLIKLLGDFNRMYRPHEAREDTILFPGIRKIISRNEYFELGEEFEAKEHELFGAEGFEMMVEKVSNLEKQLGIYELSNFTPLI